MRLGVGFGCVLVAALAIGCSNTVEQAPTGGLDSNTGNNGSGGSGGGGSTGTGTADACTTAANWQSSKLKFDTTGSPRDFAETLNALVKAQSAPAISVTNYMTPHCVWMVAFSATDDTAGSTAHAASYTEMFRHPAGLWTAKPQSTGWIRVVDAAAKTIWIPIAEVTGSASFGATDCSSLTKAEASALIPRSAGSIEIAIPTARRRRSGISWVEEPRPTAGPSASASPPTSPAKPANLFLAGGPKAAPSNTTAAGAGRRP